MASTILGTSGVKLLCMLMRNLKAKASHSLRSWGGGGQQWLYKVENSRSNPLIWRNYIKYVITKVERNV